MAERNDEQYRLWRRRSFLGSSSLLLGVVVTVVSFGLLLADFSDQLLLQRGVQAAAIVVGLFALGGVWFLQRPQTMSSL